MGIYRAVLRMYIEDCKMILGCVCEEGEGRGYVYRVCSGRYGRCYCVCLIPLRSWYVK